ncbi:MAG: divergent PAP2 family protein [Peptococcaceae bacterium]|jgi:acid phosphatase family membrane protein YuiD|nr:divergent PAP2 family protein [Peptococcaceae bacterium]
MGFFEGIAHNHILLTALGAWFIAQLMKFTLNLFLLREVDWSLLLSSGGFPSSHTASVIALSCGVGKYYGWESPLFAVAMFFSAIVMYDATGVRRAAGKQAERINQMIDTYYQGSDIAQERLKELIGHSPFEVFCGAALGIIIGMLM